MVSNCLESLNFKATNFRATGSKESLKTKTLMYCNKKKPHWNVTFVCTVLFRLRHCFYLGECVIKELKLNLFLR